MMWAYWSGPGYGWPMLWMTLWNIIWLVVIGLAIWALVRWLMHRTAGGQYHSMQGSSAPMQGPSALEILRQRYARGEIDAETFARMREQLIASGARDEEPVAPGR
jgi:putative membrane protein